MKIHYFQRYHDKENVATANTMLLLSRLYQYSTGKFFKFLKSEFFPDSFEPELTFTLQDKSIDSVPDATITQESFKIVVETKMFDWFDSNQLMRHLHSFKDERKKILLTLAPELMANEKKEAFEKQLKEYNASQIYPVIHINTTFEILVNAIMDVIDERDYEMQDVVEDYLDYCYRDKLIPISDSWKFMRMQLANQTLNFNISNNIYYEDASRNFRAHDYLGLYSNKSVRAIGKINARILAIEIKGELKFETEYGTLTQEHKDKIKLALEDGISHGYDLKNRKHRYFFVEKFYETDFKKTTPRAPMGTRIFDLSQILETDTLPETEKIAKGLREKGWG